ncbi:MAG: hypothetical protein RIR70_502, partial [Pseudomonadota bacterium]
MKIAAPSSHATSHSQLALPVAHLGDDSLTTQITPAPDLVRGCNTQLFEEVCRLFPNRVALSSAQGAITYAELNQRANQLARLLTHRYQIENQVVGVYLPRGTDCVVSMLAIWKCGGIYLPIDPHLPVQRAQYLFQDARCSLLLADHNTARHIPPDRAHLRIDEPRFGETLKAWPSDNLNHLPDPDAVAYIIYTSGTTGQPKGVQISHKNIPNMAMEHWLSGEITHRDKVFLFAPFFFDASLRDIHGALLTGANLYLPDDEEVLPGKLLETLAAQRITYAVITPSVLAATRHIPDLPHLRTLVLAGEAPDRDLIARWGQGRTIINAYGPTEATVCCAKKVYPQGLLPPGGQPTLGHATYGMELHVLDDARQPCRAGDIGELYIGGAGVSIHGYLNQPTLTAQRFINTPNAGRLYQSGDLARLTAEGEIEFIARCDQQVKINGRRIELDEIAVAIKQSAQVHDVKVRVLDDGSCIAAYLIPKDPDTPPHALRDGLCRLLKDRLPAYMIPSQWFSLDRWPTTAAGKIDLARLPRHDPKETGQLNDLPPHTPTQQHIAALLRDVLSLPASTPLGINTPLTNLGLNSLNTMYLLNALAERFHVTLSYRDFMASGQTIICLEALIQKKPDQARHDLHRDFSTEAILPASIDPAAHPRLPQALRTHPRRILLTGATGFFGAHVCAALIERFGAEVTCIVRATDAQSGLQRIRQNFQKLGLWRAHFSRHLIALPGDVSRHQFGLQSEAYAALSQNIDTIHHIAAEVNFLKSYDQLRDSNAFGTQEVIRFATNTRHKRSHFVSTLATFFSTKHTATIGFETPNSHLHTGLIGGYPQSKWVAEEMAWRAKSAGLDATIFRPARITGAYSIGPGYCPEEDLYIRLFKAFVTLKKAPDIDLRIDLTPADIAADILVRLSAQDANDIFHLTHPASLALHEVVAWLNQRGHAVELIDYTQWVDLLDSRPAIEALGPLIELFRADAMTGISAFQQLMRNASFKESSFSAEKTWKALGEGNITWPRYTQLLDRYFRHMETSGFI